MAIRHQKILTPPAPNLPRFVAIFYRVMEYLGYVLVTVALTLIIMVPLASIGFSYGATGFAYISLMLVLIGILNTLNTIAGTLSAIHKNPVIVREI